MWAPFKNSKSSKRGQYWGVKFKPIYGFIFHSIFIPGRGDGGQAGGENLGLYWVHWRPLTGPLPIWDEKKGVCPTCPTRTIWLIYWFLIKKNHFWPNLQTLKKRCRKFFSINSGSYRTVSDFLNQSRYQCPSTGQSWLDKWDTPKKSHQNPWNLTPQVSALFTYGSVI